MCSPCAQVVAQNCTHLRLILQHEIFHSHPSNLRKFCVSEYLLILEISFPTIFKYRNPLSRQCHFLVLILFLGCCGLNPGLTHSAWMVCPLNTVPRPICREFFKLLLVLTCSSFGFILFSLTKKNKEREERKKTGLQDCLFFCLSFKLALVACACIPSTQEAKADRSFARSKPAWAT